jgi:hypothetical protein
VLWFGAGSAGAGDVAGDEAADGVGGAGACDVVTVVHAARPRTAAPATAERANLMAHLPVSQAVLPGFSDLLYLVDHSS